MRDGRHFRVTSNARSVRRGGRFAALTLSLMASLCSIAQGQTITEFSVPTTDGLPIDIAAGPDGALWFTENEGNKIGRITTAGAIAEYPISGVSQRTGIAAGPDGSLWFTEAEANNIGRITTAGVISEFPLPMLNRQPTGITAGPDGNMWFTSLYGGVGRITPAGTITLFPGEGDGRITSGPDGNLWFTLPNGNGIGRITTAGVTTLFTIPTDNSFPLGIAAGPEGNLWFTEVYGNKIGRITTAGVITEFAIPTANSSPRASQPPRRRPLVCRKLQQPGRRNRPDHHRRGHHRAGDPLVFRPPDRDHNWLRRQPLVHGI